MSRLFLAESKINFGVRFKMVRMAQKLTLTKLAKMLNLSPGYLSEVENGKKAMSQELFYSLIEKLNINLNWLLTGEGEMFVKKKGDIYKEGIDSRRQAIIQLIIDMPEDKLDDIFKMLEKEKLLMDLLEERKKLKETG